MTLDLTADQLTQIATIPDRWETFSSEEQQFILQSLKAAVYDGGGFPIRYRNRDTSRIYRPHNIVEQLIVENHIPKRVLCTGGEGSGKTVLGSVKTNNAVRHITNGMLASPSLPHFKRSAWSEFIRWTEPLSVIGKHRQRLAPSWEPREPFRMVYSNHAYLDCAGIVNIGSIEGPNIHFFWLDEARHLNDANVPKTIEGRVRIVGPKGEPPQWWITTTPPPETDHWLFTYFGPLACTCPTCGDIYLRPHYVYAEQQLEVVRRKRPDLYPLWTNTGAIILANDGTARLGYENHPSAALGKFKAEWLMPERRLQNMDLLCPKCLHLVKISDEFASFKLDSMVIVLLTQENVDAGNVEPDFVETRAESLSEAEEDILLWAEWGDVKEQEPFLPHISWWDQCYSDLPPLGRDEPLIIALDAATGRKTTESDVFSVIGVTRHPDPSRAGDEVAVRLVKGWQASAGGKIDFRGIPDNPGPERFLLNLVGYDIDANGGYYWKGGPTYTVLVVIFDPHQLIDMSMRLRQLGILWMEEFPQSSLRTESDRNLLNLIQQRHITHDGSPELREHLQNADRKVTQSGLRIVKRSASRRIDHAVSVGMAAFWALRLNL